MWVTALPYESWKPYREGDDTTSRGPYSPDGESFPFTAASIRAQLTARGSGPAPTAATAPLVLLLGLCLLRTAQCCCPVAVGIPVLSSH